MSLSAHPETAADRPYVLRLFVTGTTSRSARAITNLRRMCEEHLHGRYDLEVVDLYQHPEMARTHQIVAAPTLLRVRPLPVRKIIGDLADEGKVLAGLELNSKPGMPLHR